MAAKRRHWKEKDGRYWARVSIPEKLRPFFGGKSELTESLGGDLREADRKHPAAVGRIQELIHSAAATKNSNTRPKPTETLHEVTEDDQKRAIWEHFRNTLDTDPQKRDALPTQADIDYEYELFWKRR